MEFLTPVFVGDEVSLFARMLAVGRTPMRICVEAWRRGRSEDDIEPVTRGIFTFVAIDDVRKPRTIGEAVSAESLFRKSAGSARRCFSAWSSLPMLADAAAIA